MLQQFIFSSSSSRKDRRAPKKVFIKAARRPNIWRKYEDPVSGSSVSWYRRRFRCSSCSRRLRPRFSSRSLRRMRRQSWRCCRSSRRSGSRRTPCRRCATGLPVWFCLGLRAVPPRLTAIEAERVTIDRRLEAEEAFWEKQRDRLETALRRARD